MSQRQSSSMSLLEQALLGAIALALVAMLSLPTARGVSDTFGWLPFWLVVAPVIDLVLLRRHGLPAVARMCLVRRARYRRPLRQARRLRRDQSLMPRRFFSMRRRNSDMMRRYRSSPR